MTEIEIKSIKGISLLKQGRNEEAYKEFLDAYLTLKRDVPQLKQVKSYEEVGEALFLLLTYGTIDDIDVKQRIASISYMFLSKALKESPDDANCAKLRVMLLDYCKDSLQYTAMSALNLCGGGFGFMSLGAMPELRSRDALYMMKYYDLKSFPILKIHNEFFSKIEDDLDDKIGNNFFGTRTKDDVLKEGLNNHTKMLEFIENQVIEDEDIDF